MSFFDFDGRYDESGGVGSAISRREAILLSLIVHGLLVVVLLFAPQLPWMAAVLEPVAPPPRQQPPDQRQPPFMLVETAPQPELTPERPAVRSDADRRAAAPEAPREPSNDLPFSRGSTSDLVEGAPERPEPSRPRPTPPAPAGESTAPRPSAPAVVPESNGERPATPAAQAPATGIGESLRNLDELIRRERFDNPQGGLAQSDAAISFDSKGVDFGPWLTRFIAQVKRNWLIPYAAMTLRGRVVVTFYVHRDGRITDLKVVKPSEVGAFNTAAFQALVQSNPTLALPPEYPDDRVLFTVTFYYNERPR